MAGIDDIDLVPNDAMVEALEADRSTRMIDLEAYPLNDRQLAQYENTESVVERFGKYDQTAGADGCGYVAESDRADDGIACGNCVFFMEGMCEVVSGEIAAAGLCKLWVIPAGLLEGEPEPEVEVEPELAPVPEIEGYKRSAEGMDVPEREVRLRSLRFVLRLMVVRSSRGTPPCMTMPTRLVMLIVVGLWKRSWVVLLRRALARPMCAC